MAEPATPLIFDGHNDALFTLFSEDSGDWRAFVNGTGRQIDVPQAERGGFGGGFFAVYVPSPMDMEAELKKMEQPAYDLGLPDPIDWPESMSVAVAQSAILLRLQDEGALTVCRSVEDIETGFASGRIAAILHFEGAEPIDPDFHSLEVFYAAGLRSIGIVWSRPNLFGHGVPFCFPSDGDTGPGLTDLGIELVKRCNRMGVMIDVSHLNQAGFWDVVRISDRPIVATHSNAQAICQHARNLSDKQLDAIRDSDGMVGVNFAVAFLREDGRMIDTGLDMILRHLDYLLERLGEERVGFGSDFDGARVPEALGSVAGLPKLRQAMLDHGYGEELMARLCHGNWLRVLRQTWKQPVA